VLVYHDLLGIMHHPHHEKHVPSFCKRYAKLGSEIHKALVEYRTEVADSSFPTEDYSPYKMSEEETNKFLELMRIDETSRLKSSETVAKKLREADEYEVTKLY
jgi:Ketopantoate hydroxymethyltransferase